MGTRSVTMVKDRGRTLVNIYRHYDGYPSGHGRDMVGFLKSGKLVNGLCDRQPARVFNGAGCLAAQLISFLKNDEAGNVYIESFEQDELSFIDYIYTIDVSRPINDCCRPQEYSEDGGSIEITVLNWGEEVFKGDLDAFDFFTSKEEEVVLKDDLNIFKLFTNKEEDS